MVYSETNRPISSKVLVALLVFYGVMGVISGALLISDPTGASLGFAPEFKDKVPFQSFLPVGLFLFLIYGVGSMVLAYGAWTRKESMFGSISRMVGYHWSWVGGMALTLVLVIWLAVEGSLIGLDWPATYFTVIIGAGIFLMLVLPATRRFYRVS